MTALWLEPDVHARPLSPSEGDEGLRLVEVGPLRTLVGPDGLGAAEPWPADPGTDVAGGRVAHSPRRRASLEVRRRRTLLAIFALFLLALALPLSGTGGSSHATGSAPVESGSVYTVKSGDTLWSIAERADPSADPRPLVAELAKELGSDTVTPGERITVP